MKLNVVMQAFCGKLEFGGKHVDLLKLSKFLRERGMNARFDDNFRNAMFLGYGERTLLVFSSGKVTCQGHFKKAELSRFLTSLERQIRLNRLYVRL